jgi:hypothetical protein
MKTFVTVFSAVLLAILTSAGVLYFVAIRLHSRPAVNLQSQISSEEAYARRVMKGLSPGDVITVCGKPTTDYVGDYGDYKWRILTYPHFEANFVLKEGHWQYDFISDERGRILPDASMVTRPVAIKLPCQQ